MIAYGGRIKMKGDSHWQGFVVTYDGTACKVTGMNIIPGLSEGITAISYVFVLFGGKTGKYTQN